MRPTLLAALLGSILAVPAISAPPATSEIPVRFEPLDGFAAPGTPPELNKVGVLEIGPRNARNILVLNPGTSASAAYFAPLAKTIVAKVRAGRSGPSRAGRTCSPRDVRPQQPELGESAERLRGRAGAVPRADQARRAPAASARKRSMSLATSSGCSS